MYNGGGLIKFREGYRKIKLVDVVVIYAFSGVYYSFMIAQFYFIRFEL